MKPRVVHADLERFEKWLTAIGDRDYFETAGGAKARWAVVEAWRGQAGQTFMTGTRTTAPAARVRTGWDCVEMKSPTSMFPEPFTSM
jgi:hypothetical protein